MINEHRMVYLIAKYSNFKSRAKESFDILKWVEISMDLMYISNTYANFFKLMHMRVL